MVIACPECCPGPQVKCLGVSTGTSVSSYRDPPCLAPSLAHDSLRNELSSPPFPSLPVPVLCPCPGKHLGDHPESSALAAEMLLAPSPTHFVTQARNLSAQHEEEKKNTSITNTQREPLLTLCGTFSQP